MNDLESDDDLGPLCPKCGKPKNHTLYDRVIRWCEKNKQEYIAVTDLAKGLSMSRSMAHKYLNHLTTKGFLFKHIEGKKTFFCLIKIDYYNTDDEQHDN